MTNARSLANFATGIGTEGAVLTVDNTNNRIGIATTNPQNDLQVGAGITMEGDTGQVTFVGVVTASSFSGDIITGGIDIVGNTTGLNVTGVGTFVDVNVSGAATIAGATDLNGALDVNGEVTVSPNTAGKNTITLTTNSSNDGRVLVKSDTTTKVDIQANGTSFFDGGSVEFRSADAVGIADSIFHIGDTNTKIRFPAADTFTVETGGSEALRVDSSQRLLIGATSTRGTHGGGDARLQIEGTNTATAGMSITRTSDDAGSPTFSFGKTRNGSALSDGDDVGVIYWQGDDGTDLATALCSIKGEVDGSVSGNTVPGRITFNTATTSTNLTERLRISSTGKHTITGATNGELTIKAGSSSGNDIIAFENSSGTTRGNITYDTDNNFLLFNVNQDERLRIDSSGRVLIGTNSSRDGNFNNTSGVDAQFQIEGTSFVTAFANIVRNSNDENPAGFAISKSRGAAAGSNVVVQDNDVIGEFAFQGSDGSKMVSAADIECQIDGTPGSADMPGRLIFSTNAGGTGTTERLRITSGGQVRIGSFGAPSNKNSVTPLSHVDGSGVNGGLQVNRHTSVGGGGAQLLLSATRGSSITGHTVLQNNDGIGTVDFLGSDGGEFVPAASIQAVVDADPGDDDMPGRLLFKTTANDASSPTERMRITSGGFFNFNAANNNNLMGRINIFEGGNFSTASILGAGDNDNIYLTSDATSGDGNFGASIAFSRVQHQDRRAAAIAAVQTTDDEDQVGLSFFTHQSTDATAAITEAMRLAHSGSMIMVQSGSNGQVQLGTQGFGVDVQSGNLNGVMINKDATNWGTALYINRTGSGAGDGILIEFAHGNTTEGQISVSGGTVTYGEFCGTHWGRLGDNSKPEILPGTILETINKSIEWKVVEFEVNGEQKRQAYNGSEENGASVTVEYEGVSYTGTVADEEPDSENLNKHVCVKVSDTAASKAVFGVFLGWDTSGEDQVIGAWNDMNIAALGNYFIRIKSGQSLETGDLIESDGTGCGVVQSDDIIRSKTVAKVTSTTPQKVYTDGSFLVTCVLYSG